jgi:hypothetical protein
MRLKPNLKFAGLAGSTIATFIAISALTPKTTTVFLILPAYYLFIAFCTGEILKRSQSRYPLRGWVPFLRTYQIFKATEHVDTLVFSRNDPWVGLGIKLIVVILTAPFLLMAEDIYTVYFLQLFSIIVELIGVVRLCQLCHQPIRQVSQQAKRLTLRCFSPVILLAAVYLVLAIIGYVAFIIFGIVGAIWSAIYLAGDYYHIAVLQFISYGTLSIFNFLSPIIGFIANAYVLVFNVGHHIWELSIGLAPSLFLCAPMAGVALIYGIIVTNLSERRRCLRDRASS